MSKLEENKKVMELEKELKSQNITIDQLNKPSEGLGDDLEKLFTKLGITQELLKRVTGRICGCDRRKQFLNRLFPYFRK